ncbi:hypothetical protein DPEC_G00182560 [Dallia pectoralis]|uniref:Uncharacterized protein n=1 Tax=Dallia pectoralis TaxID=75939 RepID=A0ACC2GAG4_DALPE|nr:hypothetical protein DPEC_G00182560 [Dallia pectoralis]
MMFYRLHREDIYPGKNSHRALMDHSNPFDGDGSNRRKETLGGAAVLRNAEACLSVPGDRELSNIRLKQRTAPAVTAAAGIAYAPAALGDKYQEPPQSRAAELNSNEGNNMFEGTLLQVHWRIPRPLAPRLIPVRYLSRAISRQIEYCKRSQECVSQTKSYTAVGSRRAIKRNQSAGLPQASATPRCSKSTFLAFTLELLTCRIAMVSLQAQQGGV